VSGDKDPKVTVDIGLGAKASLEARVTTEIPAQSTGRLLDTFTDMIRPFAERRGLKADLIRLQREEVAIEIARRAHRRLEIENQPINPLPNTFLVPFLEKASLEELDSLMINRWADLLASCSADPVSAHPRFVQILSEITGSDAALLRAIALHCIDKIEDPKSAFDNLTFEYDPVQFYQTLTDAFTENQTDGDKICDYIEHFFNNPGVSLRDVAMHEIGTDNHWDFRVSGENYGPAWLSEARTTLDILCSLQVISDHHLHLLLSSFEIDIYYIRMTELGIEFLRKCDHEFEQRLRAAPSC
jgi:Abortive infection alpha